MRRQKMAKEAEVFSQDDGNYIMLEGKPFTKKPSIVFILEIDGPTVVQTNSGTLAIEEPQSCICYDPLSGHVWPITKEYKEMHYVPAENG